jgi:hypothetical protein
MTAPGPQPQPAPDVIHDLTDLQEGPASIGDRLARLEAMHDGPHGHDHQVDADAEHIPHPNAQLGGDDWDGE